MIAPPARFPDGHANGHPTLNFHSLGLGDEQAHAGFRGMYRCVFDALTTVAYSVVCTQLGQLRGGEVAIVPMDARQEYASVFALRYFPGPAVLYLPPAHESFDRSVVEYLASRTLFAYGTDTSVRGPEAYESVGIHHLYLPLDSDETVMRPLGKCAS